MNTAAQLVCSAIVFVFAAAPQLSAQSTEAFDVASVKLNSTGGGGYPGARTRWHSVHRDQLTAGPRWLCLRTTSPLGRFPASQAHSTGRATTSRRNVTIQ